jgi:hypothetical protein
MLIVVPCLLLYSFYWLSGYGWNIIAELQWWWSWILSHWLFWLGLMIADTQHFFLDILTTAHENPSR